MWLIGVGVRVRLLMQHRIAMGIALVGLAALSVLGSHAIAADPPPDLVEVVEERTANSRTFKRSDGGMTTHLYAGPVHFREGGVWKPIETALTPAAPAEQGQGYGLRMKSNGFNVLVKRNLDDRYLRMDVRGRSLQLGLRGAEEGAPARPSGNRVTFGDVLPGVDLRYAMAPEGVKEEVLLKHEDAPSTYTFVLDPPEGTDLEADELPSGDWVFRLRRGGRAFFVLEAPFATDAPAGRERAGGATRRQDRDRADHDSMGVTERDGQFEITLRVDPDWLRDDARRFPVTVDPTLILQPSTQTAEFDASCGDCEGWDWGSAWIGPDDYGSPYRSAFQFDLSSIPPSASVSSAKLGLYNQADYCVWTTKPCGADAHTLNVHRMTKAWTSDVTTWSQVGWDTTVAASTTLAQGAGNQWMTWDVTSTAASWISGATANHGVLVKRSTEPTDA